MPEYHSCYDTSNQAILPRITMRFLRISTLIACSAAKTMKSSQIRSGRSSNFRVSRTKDEFHSIYVTNGMDYRTSTDLRTDQRAINHVQIPKSNSLQFPSSWNGSHRDLSVIFAIQSEAFVFEGGGYRHIRVHNEVVAGSCGHD